MPNFFFKENTRKPPSLNPKKRLATDTENNILKNKLIPAVESVYFKNEYNNIIRYSDYFFNKGADILQIISEKNGAEIKEVKKEHPELWIIGGGNINSIKKAYEYLSNQSDFLVVGRLFANKPNLIETWVKSFGSRLIISIDDKEGLLAGNDKISTDSYIEFLKRYNPKNVIYVSDNTKLVGGVNLNRFKTVRKKISNAVLIYSGGVSTLEDLKNLKKNGADAVIIGSALYNNSINLIEAKKVFCA